MFCLSSVLKCVKYMSPWNSLWIFRCGSEEEPDDDAMRKEAIYFFSVFLGRSTAWMLGNTPPWAMVTPERSLLSSSSLRIASCR